MHIMLLDWSAVVPWQTRIVVVHYAQRNNDNGELYIVFVCNIITLCCLSLTLLRRRLIGNGSLMFPVLFQEFEKDNAHYKLP
jgi:hypothetical protein